MRAYDFHPEAEADPNAIWEYIAEDNPDATDRTINRIVSTIEALVPFPQQGHRRPDLTSRSLRFISAGNYLIAYAPDKRPLWVLAVIHGRRSLRVWPQFSGAERNNLVQQRVLRAKFHKG
jgi:plasmid stabilization system protein ParE